MNVFLGLLAVLLVIAINLAIIAAMVWVVFAVLQGMGVAG